MKVYLAAPYACRDSLRAYAAELARLGMTCTSSWLNEQAALVPGQLGAAPDVDDKAAQLHVAKDLHDVTRSDVLVVWTWDRAKCLLTACGATLGENSGGRHVETGIALARGIPVVVIGQPENIFHRGVTPGPVADWHEACLTLVELAAKMPTLTAGAP